MFKWGKTNSTEQINGIRCATKDWKTYAIKCFKKANNQKPKCRIFQRVTTIEFFQAIQHGFETENHQVNRTERMAKLYCN